MSSEFWLPILASPSDRMSKECLSELASPSVNALLDHYRSIDTVTKLLSPINLSTSLQADFHSNSIVSRNLELGNPRLAGLGILNTDNQSSFDAPSCGRAAGDLQFQSNLAQWHEEDRNHQIRHTSESSDMESLMNALTSHPSSLSTDFNNIMSDSFSLPSLPSSLYSYSDVTGVEALQSNVSYLSPDFANCRSDLGMMADLNMFDHSRRTTQDVGINPMELMGSCSLAPFATEEELNVACSKPNQQDEPWEQASDDPFSQEAIQSFFKIIEASRAIRPGHTRASSTAASMCTPLRTLNGFYAQSESPTTRPRMMRSRTLPTHSSSNYQSRIKARATPFDANGEDERQPDTPILNAHLGVDIEEVRSRAVAYRARYPGLEIDKKWLMVYAGKLSERGELLEDYRCYISGCKQVNRRRDHILVHVGSHVDQRPFQCGQCSLRFLRKNECKRHEAGHMTSRPFVCELCPEHDIKSFVRLDLMKRHLKRSHGCDEMVGPRPPKRSISY